MDTLEQVLIWILLAVFVTLLLVALAALGAAVARFLTGALSRQADDDEPASPADADPLAEVGFMDAIPALNPALRDPEARPGRHREPYDGPLVTVATYSQPHEAHIARLRLEGHEIPAFVADENLVGMDWLYSLAVGGVKLQVPESAVELAQRVLSEPHPSPMQWTVDESLAPEADVPDTDADTDAAATDAPPIQAYDEGYPAPPRCLACGADEAYPQRQLRRKIAYLSLLLLSFPLPLGRTWYECNRCGHRWPARRHADKHVGASTP